VDIKKISRPNFYMMWVKKIIPQYNVLKPGINALFPLPIRTGGKHARSRTGKLVESWLSRGGASGITG
jgi:hypothetical protein